MIIWINGAFGAGKTQAAYELRRRAENAYVYDPENAGYFIHMFFLCECLYIELFSLQLVVKFASLTKYVLA